MEEILASIRRIIAEDQDVAKEPEPEAAEEESADEDAGAEDVLELPEPVAFEELGLRKRVAPLNLEVHDAVEEEVHPCNGRAHEVELLPVQLEVPVLLALPLELYGC